MESGTITLIIIQYKTCHNIITCIPTPLPIHLFAVTLFLLTLYRDKYVGCLLAPHHRDTGIWPLVQEAWATSSDKTKITCFLLMQNKSHGFWAMQKWL